MYLTNHIIRAALRALCLTAALLTTSVSAHAIVGAQLSPRAQVAARSAAPDSIVSAYLTVDPSVLDRSRLSGLGVSIGIDLGSTLTVRMPASALPQLAEVEGVSYVQTAIPAITMLDEARQATGITSVNTGSSLPKAYTGQGVIVGIIDSGFDYTHPAFSGADGRLRISRVWEQGAEPVMSVPELCAVSAPERFGYGVELTTPEAIIAAGGDIRNNSHGTHVASLAAGADHYFDSALQGMAPDAEIVLVSMTSQGLNNVCISDAIAYIFDYADAMGRPCVVNLSLGAHNGPHDGTSTFDVIADALQGPGRLIVGAAGNSHYGGFHVQHSFASADDEPLTALLDYHLTLSEKNVGGQVEIWMSAGADMEVALVAYKTSSQEVVERQVVYPAATRAANDITLGRNIVGSITAVAEVSPLNGKGHVLLTSAVTGIRSGYAVGIEVTPRTAGDIDMWADDYSLGFSTKGLDGIADPTLAPTVSEIGGTAKRILTVGAYTTRSEYSLLGETRTLALDETVGEICSFSNFGPTVDGRIKPQVCAPGCFIKGAVSTYDSSGTLSLAEVVDVDDTMYFYGYMQGTSMATPIVTGIVATWLEAWPDMTPEDLASVVAATSARDEFTGDLTQPDNHWGYGKIDAYAGISECIKRSGADGINDVAAEGIGRTRIVCDGSLAHVIFATAVASASIDVYSAQGALVMSQKVHDMSAGSSLTLDLSPLTPGIYLISTPDTTLKIAR